MSLRVAELETLFTANVDQVAKAEQTVKATGKRIESKPITAKVDADTKGAVAGMDRVEAQAKRIVSAKTMATVDANIDRAEKSFMKVYERLDYLKSVRTELDVEADIKRAEANLQRVQRNLDGLRSARAVMEVDANTAPAEEALQGAKDAAGKAGDDAGEEFGASVVAALVSIPIAGAVIALGAAAGKALVDGLEQGLQIEARYDRLAGLAGLDAPDAQRIGFAAGEAYANAFGDSIESNMDTARLAVQFNILDADATTRDAQRVIQGLSGIADVLGEEVRPSAQAVTVMLQSGIARSAEHAFDILAAGAREGVNRSEDLLDTFTEYPALFARLGLSGEEALGLINQGLDAGAFNSDKVADALKELQIRATDASELSAEGFRLIGLNAEEMTAKMAAGGPAAREGLDQILDGLRAIEDPVARNAAGVALVGTQWEDLGDAMLALDLTTAVDQLNGVDGAAQRMFDTLADNSATKIEQAKRNIEVAAEGIQGALAAAFEDPLADAADWVSQNRGPVLQFFLDLANGALDFGESMVEGLASGTEGLGQFVSGPLADFVYVVADVLGKLPWPFNQDTSGLKEAADEMRGFTDVTSEAADSIRTTLGGAIDEARLRLNEFGEPAVRFGQLNDASLRLAESIASVGSESGTLEQQIQATVAAMDAELVAAAAAGESQQNLKDRYNAATEALVDQLEQMGLTEQEARDMVAAYGLIPDRVDTVVTAATAEAQATINRFIWSNDGRRINLIVDGVPGRQVHGSDVIARAMGGIVEYMASGGIRGGLTPMQPIAQMVPANTWRVVGDRGDVAEAFIPLDGSPRSLAILAETIRRMPGFSPMADGGIVGGGSSLVGLRIAGRLVVDASGFAEIVDARVVEVVRGAMSPFAGGRR